MKLSRFVIHSFVVFSIKALKVLVTLYGSKRNRIQYLFQLVSLGFKSQQWNDWLAWGWMLEQHTWCYYNANPNLVMKMSETYTGSDVPQVNKVHQGVEGPRQPAGKWATGTNLKCKWTRDQNYRLLICDYSSHSWERLFPEMDGTDSNPSKFAQKQLSWLRKRSFLSVPTYRSGNCCHTERSKSTNGTGMGS